MHQGVLAMQEGAITMQQGGLAMELGGGRTQNICEINRLCLI